MAMRRLAVRELLHRAGNWRRTRRPRGKWNRKDRREGDLHQGVTGAAAPGGVPADAQTAPPAALPPRAGSVGLEVAAELAGAAGIAGGGRNATGMRVVLPRNKIVHKIGRSLFGRETRSIKCNLI